MHLFVLALIFSLFAHDAYNLTAQGDRLASWGLVAIFVVPKLVLAAGYWGLCRMAWAGLDQPKASSWIRVLDQATNSYRYLVLLLYLSDLWFGVLNTTRQVLGDLVMLDELIFITPPLMMIVWSWWAYYPIDRRLREATLIRWMDTGKPVHPVWTASQYVISQFRHQVLLVLVPLVLMCTWMELVERYTPRFWPSAELDPRPWLTLTGTAIIILCTPLIIRHLWDTIPLPAGKLRERLMAMCKQYRVGVRELLLWRTGGGMVNGAVMGVISPLRYILLTDALLELLPQEAVQAVMAHEIAHVRRHHLFWLLAVAGGTVGLLMIGGTVFVALVNQAIEAQTDPYAAGAELTSIESIQAIVIGPMVALAGWVFIFGWVSRRFERQADTFAVQHIARQRVQANNQLETQVIDARSISVMTTALELVAQLNHISTGRRSWRHGSIAWRQAYLRTLDGKPIDGLPIDRVVGAIKLIGASAIAAAIASQLALNELGWLTL